LIEWQFRTMDSPSETAGDSWEEINKDKQLWHIPAKRIKKDRAHTASVIEPTLGG